MDLLDFDAGPLYFDDPLAPAAVALIRDAAELYPDPEAETLLRAAETLAPRHLEVTVALYRFYFYQNRLEEADQVADRALEIAGSGIGYPADWRALTAAQVAAGLATNAGMARFWLMALKAKAVLALRRERIPEALAMLGTIAGVDERDRLGARALIEVAQIHRSSNVIAVDFSAPSL